MLTSWEAILEKMSTAPRLPPPRGAPALSVSDDQAPRPRLAEPTRGQPPKPLKSPLSTSSSPSPSQSPPDAAPPMASPAAPLALLILLVSLAIAAAQSGQPSSPPRNSTNISDGTDFSHSLMWCPNRDELASSKSSRMCACVCGDRVSLSSPQRPPCTRCSRSGDWRMAPCRRGTTRAGSSSGLIRRKWKRPSTALAAATSAALRTCKRAHLKSSIGFWRLTLWGKEMKWWVFSPWMMQERHRLQEHHLYPSGALQFDGAGLSVSPGIGIRYRKTAYLRKCYNWSVVNLW